MHRRLHVTTNSDSSFNKQSLPTCLFSHKSKHVLGHKTGVELPVKPMRCASGIGGAALRARTLLHGLDDTQRINARPIRMSRVCHGNMGSVPPIRRVSGVRDVSGSCSDIAGLKSSRHQVEVGHGGARQETEATTVDPQFAFPQSQLETLFSRCLCSNVSLSTLEILIASMMASQRGHISI
jgi:hypothetical protein